MSFPVSNMKISKVNLKPIPTSINKIPHLIWQALSQYWTDIHPVHFDIERFGGSFFVNWHAGLLQPTRGLAGRPNAVFCVFSSDLLLSLSSPRVRDSLIISLATNMWPGVERRLMRSRMFSQTFGISVDIFRYERSFGLLQFWFVRMRSRSICIRAPTVY